MKVILAGGTGQVGQVLARAFIAAGHDVVVLSRNGSANAGRVVLWDGRTLGPWAAEIEGADAVINLAGRSVNCRYTPSNMRAMLDSRVESTRVVGEAIAQAVCPPRTWLQMSTATIYSHRLDAPNDEATGVMGGTEVGVPAYWAFSVKIAQEWEQAQTEAQTPATRKVSLRTAMVMSPDREGIFDVLLGLVRRGLGGSAAGGQQYVSWIHDSDFIRAVTFLLDSDDLKGPVNLASPEPIPYSLFLRALRDAWGIGFGLPAAKWMLKIGAWAMGTDTELILKSRRVVPGRLLNAGFCFDHPTWSEAAIDLVHRWRQAGRNK